jgi:hypothetical protein
MQMLPILAEKMKAGALLLFVATVALGVAPQAEAVDFVMRESTGVFHFECVNACGPVRARKSGKCEYFVQSLYFTGKVKACEVEIAALKACGEKKFDEPKREDLLNPACL